MRILFTFAGGTGHVRPLLPLARAAAGAGHTVAFAGPRRTLPAVEAAGFPAFSTREPSPDAVTRGPLLTPDASREERDLRERFVRAGGRVQAAAVSDVIVSWKPDLLVREEADVGAAIAAERLGVPAAMMIVLAAGGFLRPDVVAESLHEIRAEHGLDQDESLAMLTGDLVLAPFPASFRDPEFPMPGNTFCFRQHDVPLARPELVHFTLGTEFNAESGDLFDRGLAGLRGVGREVAAVTGPSIDPAEFDPQPAHIRVEGFVPQEELLPRCAVVICHGGAGSTLGALTHGVPVIVLPLGADQPHNARRVVELGAGLTLDPVTVTPDGLADAVRTVDNDGGFREAAKRFHTENAALPPVAEVVARLESLV